MLSQLFINLVGIKKIIVPGDFLSSRGAKAIKCSVKAAEGYLYPLKSSVVFIHKPVLYIRHSELRFVEFSRIGGGSSGLSRSFDVTLTKLNDGGKITFMSIDKEEQQLFGDFVSWIDNYNSYILNSWSEKANAKMEDDDVDVVDDIVDIEIDDEDAA